MAAYRQSKDILARSETWTSWHLGYENRYGRSGKPVSINRIAQSYDSGRVLHPSRLPDPPKSPIKVIPYNDLHKNSYNNGLFLDLSKSPKSEVLTRLSSPTNRTSSDNCLSGPLPNYNSPSYKPSKKITSLSTLNRSSSFNLETKQNKTPMSSVLRKHLVSNITTLPGYVLALESSKNRSGKKIYEYNKVKR